MMERTPDDVVRAQTFVRTTSRTLSTADELVEDARSTGDDVLLRRAEAYRKLAVRKLAQAKREYARAHDRWRREGKCGSAIVTADGERRCALPFGHRGRHRVETDDGEPS